MAKENMTIIDKAIIDYKVINEAAELVAAKKLAKEFPEKFNEMLNEELNKNKSDKEPYKRVETKESKKLDETEIKNEKPVMKETNKETEEVVNEERDKDFTGDTENDTPNLGKGATEKGDTFIENSPKDSLADKTGENADQNKSKKLGLVEELDITGLNTGDSNSALDNAGGDDEIITLDDIQREIQEMETLDVVTNVPAPAPEVAAPQVAEPTEVSGLDAIRNQMSEMMGAIDKLGEMKNAAPIEEEEVVTDADVDAVVVDETVGIGISDGTVTTGKLGDHQGTHGRFRQNESVKVSALILENKKLSKEVNETKSYKKTINSLLENYKLTLDKYRKQLKEMAVHNTKLSHVNNLLVNETLSLTQDDKIKIINEMKGVESIADSKAKYSSLLSEMAEGKSTIIESVESKVTDSVGSSSKKVAEVVETTLYENDDHLAHIKRNMNYGLGKKNNLNS